VLEILITFPIMFVGLLLPALAQTFAAEKKEEFMNLFQRGVDALLLLVAPIVIGGWIVAREILVAIGKESYAPAAGVLQLLLLAVAASYLSALSGHTITIINKQRQMIWGYFSVAVVGLLTYLLLIPRFSYYGAAIGTIVTEVLAAVIGYTMILRTLQFRLRLSNIWKIVFSGAVMAGTMLLLRPIQPWVALIVGSFVYLGMIFATRAIPVSFLRGMFQRSGTPEIVTPTL
jgi:O-antigen/teichoic acid export membrane protein